MNAVRRSGSLHPFAVLAAGVYAADLFLVRPAIPHVSRPGLLVSAILIDLLVVVPAAYWWLCLRGRQSAARVVPVLMLSVAGAAAVLPVSWRGVGPALLLLALPAELGVVAMVVLRARKALRGAGAGDADAAERIRGAMLDVLPHRGAAEAIAYEVVLLYYAVMGWRARPEPGENTFSYHRKSGYGGIVFALVVATLVESIAVHVLVAPHGRRGAWLLTAASIYGIAWMLGDYQGVRLRPIVVADDALHLRTGLRWTASVPWDAVAALVPCRGTVPPKGTPGWLRMTAMGAPNLVLELARPVEARGPYGITRRADRISLALDDVARFRAVVERRLAGRTAGPGR
jgi:hypothetical protein